MKKYLFPILVVSIGLMVGFIVLAVSKEDIVFPVAELGNCANEQECKTFCDNPENMESCVSFAKKHNLMSQEEIEKAEKFIKAGKEGPGGCKGPDECESYCSNIDHINECLAFAEKYDIVGEEELSEIKKIHQLLAQGEKLPGGCKSKDQCEQYCSNPGNMEECIAFAEKAGFMPQEEVEEAKKVMAALKRGVKPPPCMGKGARGGREVCDAYCHEQENFEVCFNFAREAGLMSDEELKEADKMMSAIRKGVKPPKCRSEKECRVYCEEPEHIEECMEFALAAGFMNPDEAEMIRKTGGKGPGDCRGEKECRAFCENPENQEVCFKFASEHGLVPEEELVNMKEGLGRMQEGLNQAPPEVRGCLENNLGKELVNKILDGSLTMGPHMRGMGEKMKECFEKFMPASQEFEQRGLPGSEFPQNFSGPGGCRTPEECREYCSKTENTDKCKIFEGLQGERHEGPLPDDSQKYPSQYPKETPEEFKNLEEQYRQQYEQQYQEQYRQQYEKQYQQQLQDYQNQPPPEEQFKEGSGEPTGFLKKLLREAAAFLFQPIVELLK